PYAYYDRAHGNLQVDLADLRRKLEQLQASFAATGPEELRRLIGELLGTDLPMFEKDLREVANRPLPTVPAKPTVPQPPPPPFAAAAQAIDAGQQKYTDIRAPVLAIY